MTHERAQKAAYGECLVVGPVSCTSLTSLVFRRVFWAEDSIGAESIGAVKLL